MGASEGEARCWGDEATPGEEVPSNWAHPTGAHPEETQRGEVHPGAWAQALGLRVPLVCAPMGGVAGGALAGAVSRAGALGMIGLGSAASVDLFERELARLDTGGAPFGVGLVGWVVQRQPTLLECVLEAAPTVVSVSFLEWGEVRGAGWIRDIHRAGAQLITQVSTAEEARLAEAAGVDAVVARGLEAGGHGDPQHTRDALLGAVLGAVRVPVLAAGAVADRDDVRRVIDAGGSGAWVGTAFSACEESLTSAAAREVLLRATGEQTIVSRVLDVALDLPWPARFPERLLRTPFVEQWQGHEEALAADAVARAAFREAYAADDFQVVPLDAGMGVGALTAVESADAVVARLADDWTPR